MSNTNKLVASSKQNEEYIDIKKVMSILNVSKPTAMEILKECKDVKEVKAGTGSKQKLYNINEVNKIKSVKSEQKALDTLEKQANTLVSKKDEKVIGTAYYNNFNKLELNDQAKSISVLLSSFMKNVNDFKDNKIIELENKIAEKDEEIIELKNLINGIEGKGKIKELQKQFTDYVSKKCKNNNLVYGDVYNDIYNTLSKRYNIDFSNREKKQSIIEYIASLNNGKKYLMELLTIAGTYFI